MEIFSAYLLFVYIWFASITINDASNCSVDAQEFGINFQNYCQVIPSDSYLVTLARLMCCESNRKALRHFRFQDEVDFNEIKLNLTEFRVLLEDLVANNTTLSARLADLSSLESRLASLELQVASLEANASASRENAAWLNQTLSELTFRQEDLRNSVETSLKELRSVTNESFTNTSSRISTLHETVGLADNLLAAFVSNATPCREDFNERLNEIVEVTLPEINATYVAAVEATKEKIEGIENNLENLTTTVEENIETIDNNITYILMELERLEFMETSSITTFLSLTTDGTTTSMDAPSTTRTTTIVATDEASPTTMTTPRETTISEETIPETTTGREETTTLTTTTIAVETMETTLEIISSTAKEETTVETTSTSAFTNTTTTHNTTTSTTTIQINDTCLPDFYSCIWSTPFPFSFENVSLVWSLDCSGDYCDFETSTDDGTWLRFQRHHPGKTGLSLFADAGWDDYVEGFGDARTDGEFWLGLENLYQISSIGTWELMIKFTYRDLNDTGYLDAYEVYEYFKIYDWTTNYTLEYGMLKDQKNTTANPSFDAYDMNFVPFTTRDVDNDLNSTVNCAKSTFEPGGGGGSGGWWFSICGSQVSSFVCLNCNRLEDESGILKVSGVEYLVKATEMLLRPAPA